MYTGTFWTILKVANPILKRKKSVLTDLDKAQTIPVPVLTIIANI
jgi:hypothetical protein